MSNPEADVRAPSRTPSARPKASARSDGDARGRLLSAGLRLFAEQGFKATSVRELAREANVNLAAISYHFGDKAALYREIFSAKVREQMPGHSLDLLAMPLEQALQAFYRDFLEPLKRDQETALMMKLHFRELFEPTGAWQQVVEQELRPRFSELTRLLQRELGLARIDRDVHRAALAMVGMAVHLFTCQDEVRHLAPGVLGASRGIDVLAQRLAGYACAIIEGERLRGRETDPTVMQSAPLVRPKSCSDGPDKSAVTNAGTPPGQGVGGAMERAFTNRRRDGRPGFRSATRWNPPSALDADPSARMTIGPLGNTRKRGAAAQRAGNRR
jgi:AcrR family transcriptional regulator